MKRKAPLSSDDICNMLWLYGDNDRGAVLTKGYLYRITGTDIFEGDVYVPSHYWRTKMRLHLKNLNKEVLHPNTKKIDCLTIMRLVADKHATYEFV